jgi:hypothetical protein
MIVNRNVASDMLSPNFVTSGPSSKEVASNNAPPPGTTRSTSNPVYTRSNEKRNEIVEIMDSEDEVEFSQTEVRVNSFMHA